MGKSSALEVSITTLPLSASPTARSASSEPWPFVALMNTSASRSWYAASGRSSPAHSSRCPGLLRVPCPDDNLMTGSGEGLAECPPDRTRSQNGNLHGYIMD